MHCWSTTHRASTLLGGGSVCEAASWYQQKHGINIRQDAPSHFLLVVQFHEGRKIVFRHQTENVLPRPGIIPLTLFPLYSASRHRRRQCQFNLRRAVNASRRSGRHFAFATPPWQRRAWCLLQNHMAVTCVGGARFCVFWSPGLRMSYGCTEREENLRQIVVANHGRKRFDCLIDQTVTLCVVKRRLQIKYGSKNGGEKYKGEDLRSQILCSSFVVIHWLLKLSNCFCRS